MFLDKKLLKRFRPTSGASRNKITLKLSLLTNYKMKKLSTRVKNYAGRSSFGRITVFSKGNRSLKTRLVATNKSFRDTSVSFISGFVINSITTSLRAAVYSSSGRVSYVPATDHNFLFNLTTFYSLKNRKSELFSNIMSLKRYINLLPSFFIIRRLPKNKFVSNLEIFPGKGVQYVQSSGSKAIILKMDTRTGAALVKLPSGVRKVFSIYSIGSLGRPCLKSKNEINLTSASVRVIRGHKPQTRGVAKNPVDHPHGGRTKSIKYPRTPWGKTTKFK